MDKRLLLTAAMPRTRALLSGHSRAIKAATLIMNCPQVANISCLQETQGFPNAVNEQKFPSVVLQPGSTYRHELVYKFHYSRLTAGPRGLAYSP